MDHAHPGLEGGAQSIFDPFRKQGAGMIFSYTVILTPSILVPNTDPTDILIQHIDMTSEPHIRAVMAEKWSSYLAKKEIYPIPVPSVWVSEEIFEGPIERELFGVDLQCVIRPESFNLNTYESEIGKKWPFDKSRFRAIALR